MNWNDLLFCLLFAVLFCGAGLVVWVLEVIVLFLVGLRRIRAGEDRMERIRAAEKRLERTRAEVEERMRRMR